MSFARHLALAAILLAGSVPVVADEAVDTFNKLYGDDLKRVAATPSAADDVALAKQMLDDAQKAGNQPAFLTLLCEKAYELALKDPTGYPTAEAAMKLLAAGVAEKKVEALQKIAAIYQRPYATARAEAKTKAGEVLIESLRDLAKAQSAAEDSDGAGATLKQALAVATVIRSGSRAPLQAQLAALASQQQAEKQVAALKAKLDADPKDTASRKELVRLYLVEVDNPAEAAKLVDETLDAATRKYVPAAAKPVENAPEAACTEMGDWYKGLADQAATPASKGAMLRRAQTYYQRFLVLHTAADLGRTAATLNLKRIDDALAKLPPAPEPKSDPSNMTLDLGNGVTMKLVLIRPGKFMMGPSGSEQGRAKNESPQREVVITKPFYMGVTEVTQAQYEAVMGANPSKYKGPTNPVEMVSWDDAVEFCRKISEKTRQAARLPTDAEWEYACRAGTTAKFSFGVADSALDDYGWYGWTGPNSDGKPHPVGQKKPNAWGLYDMHGSMWEWCQDFYSRYAAGAVTDPEGPGSGTSRVLRGGSWVTGPGGCGSASRRDGPQDLRYHSYGFRAAASVSAPGYSSNPQPSQGITGQPAKKGASIAPSKPQPSQGNTGQGAKKDVSAAPSSLQAELPKERTLDLGGGITIKLVLIPAGKFMMCDGKDRHEVTLSKPFYMGVMEVTQAQYEAVIGTNPSKFKGATNPVEMICWNDATEFCKKLSEKTRQAARLPTEAEWEYACRAGTATAYSFGDSDSALGGYAWSIANGGGTTHPVGQKKPNPWGLYDMHGNVWEWCADWFGDYPKGAVTDPQGPASGTLRVMRSGSWHDDKCRSANVNPRAPDRRVDHYGIRVVVPVSAPGL